MQPTRKELAHATREAIRATQPIYAQVARIYAMSKCTMSLEAILVSTLPPEAQTNVDTLVQLADYVARKTISDCLNRDLPTFFY